MTLTQACFAAGRVSPRQDGRYTDSRRAVEKGLQRDIGPRTMEPQPVEARACPLRNPVQRLDECISVQRR
jgi:hypothetical protein